MLIELAGLLATAALLITLIALEVQRAGPDTGQPAPRPDTGQATPRRLLGLTVNRAVLALMWTMYLFLFVPRVLGLLA